MLKPHNAIPVFDNNENELNDSGKKVIVNSVGGALVNVNGKVIYGPCRFWYIANKKVGMKNNKPFYKKRKFITGVLWCVRLKGYNLNLHFAESELTFLD